jgi:hypothetical protein
VRGPRSNGAGLPDPEQAELATHAEQSQQPTGCAFLLRAAEEQRQVDAEVGFDQASCEGNGGRAQAGHLVQHHYRGAGAALEHVVGEPAVVEAALLEPVHGRLLPFPGGAVSSLAAASLIVV